MNYKLNSNPIQVSGQPIVALFLQTKNSTYPLIVSSMDGRFILTHIIPSIYDSNLPDYHSHSLSTLLNIYAPADWQQRKQLFFSLLQFSPLTTYLFDSNIKTMLLGDFNCGIYNSLSSASSNSNTR